MSANDICRVSAETRQHLEEQAQNDQFGRPTLNLWDDAAFRSICGETFGPAVQDLLQRLEQIDRTNDSFGADKGKSFDFILPALYKLRDAYVTELGGQ